MADEAVQDAAAEAESDGDRDANGRLRQYRNTDRGARKSLEGKVVSTKGEKTLVVSIERMERHRKYHKYIRKHTKVYAHDEKGEAGTGDLVEVSECRPMSKLKRFRLVRVTKKAGS